MPQAELLHLVKFVLPVPVVEGISPSAGGEPVGSSSCALVKDMLEAVLAVVLEAVVVVETACGGVEAMVHLRGERLSLEPKLRLHVGGERRPQLRVLLDEPERAVVHRAAGEEAIVRVHVALHVTHAQPAHDQLRLPRGDSARQRRPVARLDVVSKLPGARKLGQLPELGRRLARALHAARLA